MCIRDSRKDNAWAEANPDEVQQEYLISDRHTARGTTLRIRLMDGFHTQQLKVNTLDDPKRWWEVVEMCIRDRLKVRFEYVLLSIVGCISDGPTAALIASSAQWKTLINIGLLMGVLAGALGNYVGIGVAYAIRAFIGA